MVYDLPHELPNGDGLRKLGNIGKISNLGKMLKLGGHSPLSSKRMAIAVKKYTKADMKNL